MEARGGKIAGSLDKRTEGGRWNSYKDLALSLLSRQFIHLYPVYVVNENDLPWLIRLRTVPMSPMLSEKVLLIFRHESDREEGSSNGRVRPLELHMPRLQVRSVPFCRVSQVRYGMTE